MPAHIVVVDIDRKNRKDGFRDFERLDGCDPRDVVTPVATTPSGGLHLYFLASKAYKNAVAIDGTGIDTRTAGGYVILPAGGNGRRWLRKLSSTPMRPSPSWLDCAARQEPPASLFRRPAPASRASGGLIGRTFLVRAVRLIMTAPRGVQEDTRHRQAYFIGTLIAAEGIDYDVAYQALVAAANAMPAYGKPWRNLEAKVAASLARGMREGGGDDGDQ